MTEVTLDSYIVPTTVSNSNGSWYPGFKHGLRIFYWNAYPYGSEEAAAAAAKRTLALITEDLNRALGFGTEYSPWELT
jgi:hypothetical protein